MSSTRANGSENSGGRDACFYFYNGETDRARDVLEELGGGGDWGCWPPFGPIAAEA